MLIEAIKSKIITTNDNIITVLTALLKSHQIQEGDIIVIASKVLAMTQNRLRKIKNQKEFHKLVEREADKIIGKGKLGDDLKPSPTLTLKENIFTPWAGIDRSNVPKNHAVLWPKEPYLASERLVNFIKKKFGLKKMGIIIADSFCAPLRKGTSAIALGYAGFEGVRDLRGQKDLYKKKLQFTRQAVADNLATAANLVMGESIERTPFVIIRNAPVVFSQRKINPNSLIMRKKECLYSPLYEQKNI